MQYYDHSDQDRFSRDEERGEDYNYDIDDDEDVDDDDADDIDDVDDDDDIDFDDGDDDDDDGDKDDGDKNVCRFSSIFLDTRSQTWCIWLGVR